MKFVEPQLCTLSESVPSGPGWIFEVKYDGYRIQAHISGGGARLLTRRGLDWTDRFPAITTELEDLTASAVLDGELVAPGKAKLPFQRLQQALDAEHSQALILYVFDLLELGGKDLRSLPLTLRREKLKEVLRGTKRSRVRLGQRLRGAPAAILASACQRGLEGIICKQIDAPYRSSRGPSWLKVKCGQRQEFVVIGFTEPKGSRDALGALLLGVYERGRLRSAGKVGTGFPTALLAPLRRRLNRIERATSPIPGVMSKAPAGVHWVSPRLVVEVSFTEWTADGQLRHPSFQGMRVDKNPREVVREKPGSVPRGA